MNDAQAIHAAFLQMGDAYGRLLAAQQRKVEQLEQQVAALAKGNEELAKRISAELSVSDGLRSQLAAASERLSTMRSEVPALTSEALARVDAETFTRDEIGAVLDDAEGTT